MINKFERRIEVNNWLIKARWFYLSGIVFIALLAQAFDRYDLPDKAIWQYLAIGSVFNFFSFLILFFCKKFFLKKLANFLSYWQIIFELIFFSFVFYYSGGLEGLSPLFFFLPIMSAGFFFGSTGSIVTAVLSGLAITSIVTMEYMGILPHIFRYEVRVIEYSDFLIALTNVVPYSVFYIIIGAYSGHISSLLIRREDLLDEKTSSLEQESRYRKNEWKQLDKTAKLLVKRDRELINANRELDKKVKELKRSEMAMLKAFSDLKEGKRALESEKNRTSAIIENIIDPIIVLNNKNKIELLNQSARTVFNFNEGYAKVEIDSKNNFSMKNFKSIIGSDYKVFIIPEQENGDKNEELVIEIGGQETTYRVVTAKVIDKNKKHLGIMKIFYNLTREKILDKLKSEFISIAAHQLRTPLSAIKWVIKMILDGDAGELTEDQEQLLKKGYKSNERIIVLVNDMLNVSRIEEGRFGYNIQKDDLTKVLDNILESLVELINKKSIKLTVSKEPDFPLLNIDAKKMTLVLQNLIENAIKYSPEHGKISIKMRKDEKFVKVIIKDNGIGIPEADKKKLFSKFYRAENALRLQTEGSGLGLFIVKNIVKKHGGDINFESEEGVGTKFIITLPIEFKSSEENEIKSQE